jgi:hypothetical protein
LQAFLFKRHLWYLYVIHKAQKEDFMPITDQDYQLNDLWVTASGINFRNTYFYRAQSGSPAANDLAQAFQNDIVPELADLLHVNMTHSSIVVFNLDDTGDFDTLNDGATDGVRGGIAMPNFVATSIRFNRSNRLFRDGHKRYGLMSQSDVSGNNIAAAQAAAWDTFAGLLLTLLEGTLAGYRLMTPRRTLVDNSYQLVDLSQPQSVQVQSITSQRTRKVGIGE